MTDERAARLDLPTGTVTFLRTDVEGSMALARALGDGWDEINAAHLGLIRRAVDAHGGVCVRTEGDAFFGVFPEAGAAVAAAVEAQRALSEHAWPDEAPIRVRMGLHSGEAHRAGDDYGGFDVNRAARIAAAGHGGQIVLSEPTRLLAEAVLTVGVSARDLGRHVLRDVPAPERLFQLDIPGLRVDFPPLRTSRPITGNLPVRMTSFIGRDEELDELRELLLANRLVTLTGPGGIGKTSLAVEAARAAADAFPDGAWFVALDSVADPSLVSTEIAGTLGLFDGPDRPAKAGLSRYLAERATLLVIDNFEHLLDAAGDVAAILRASLGTRIVITSRAPLHIAGEQEYPVRSLPIRGDACSKLFLERARAVRPGWLPGVDAGVVDDVCALLDGLPLGLELAAARVSLLPVIAIRDRLVSRLPLPGSGPRDVPDRQRTLDGAIAWSHDLLSFREQQLLHELAVFEGGFDIEQATAVCGTDVVDGLSTLVDHSLVTRESGNDTADVRFRLLQTIRIFALDRLVADGREPELRVRHAKAYLDLIERVGEHLPGTDQARWLDRLDLDYANLRSATRWAIDAGEVEIALRLVAASWRFWQLDGHLGEGKDLADAAMAMPGADAPTAARVGALAAAGSIAYWRANPLVASQLYEEQRDLAVQLGDRAAEADALYNIAFAKYLTVDEEAAFSTMDEAVELFRELGDKRGVAHALWVRGTIALNRGKPGEAISIFEQGLATFESLGDAWYHALAAGSLAWSYNAAGNKREAARWLVQSLVETLALRDVATTTVTLPAAAILAIEAARPEDAAVILGAFEGLAERYGVLPPAGLDWLISGGDPYARVQAMLDPDHQVAAKDRGRRMSLDEAVGLVVQIGDEFQREGARLSGQ